MARGDGDETPIGAAPVLCVSIVLRSPASLLKTFFARPLSLELLIFLKLQVVVLSLSEPISRSCVSYRSYLEIGVAMSSNSELNTVLKDLKSGRTATPVTIRTFLSWFGMQRRTASNVDYINNQLKLTGIRTVPSYLDIWVDTPITFELISQHKNENKPVSASENSVDAIDAPAENKSPDDPSFRIGKIESARNLPVSVKPNATLQEAITIMLARNFSQLPVMTTDREVKGVISWESIGRRYVTSGSGSEVQHHMDEAHEISATASLFAGIKIIMDHGYVLIRSPDKKISGIVTSTDITRQFEETSTPFLLLAEIENNLRALISNKITIDDMKASCAEEFLPKNLKSANDLSFGNYVRILENEKNWISLNLKLDRVTFCEELSRVNAIRNDVMHFDPDPLTEENLSTLRNVAKMLDLFRTLKAF
ncbi:CBS domain-containing protein [Shinella curvata]|uniref:CBS domain-containing protein n=1 Tax=Shinella curvata TaxID=1817964 RepID=A0ABT8XK17_9HYPH|nr:CBS domain-containing protein [Shinella curvata]MCJ8056367.1 CBS domain-containing protein [Shinella curvata]MDO6124078.1 CBS domain-containing protein [Shinella curvata]